MGTSSCEIPCHCSMAGTRRWTNISPTTSDPPSTWQGPSHRAMPSSHGGLLQRACTLDRARLLSPATSLPPTCPASPPLPRLLCQAISLARAAVPASRRPIFKALVSSPGVDFIHERVQRGESVYVHCKNGAMHVRMRVRAPSKGRAATMRKSRIERLPTHTMLFPSAPVLVLGLRACERAKWGLRGDAW